MRATILRFKFSFYQKKTAPFNRYINIEWMPICVPSSWLVFFNALERAFSN